MWEPSQRLTPTAALEHAWIQQSTQLSGPYNGGSHQPEAATSAVEAAEALTPDALTYCCPRNTLHVRRWSVHRDDMMQVLASGAECAEHGKPQHSRLKEFGALFRQAVVKLCVDVSMLPAIC